MACGDFEAKDFMVVLFSLASLIVSLFALSFTRRNSRKDTLLKLLDKYLDLMKTRHEALEKKDPSKLEVHYRELFDLHWTEYHLFRQKMIDIEVYGAWIKRRYKDYCIQESLITEPANSITYAYLWKKLVNEGYFEGDDTFVAHMKLVHEGNFNAALEII